MQPISHIAYLLDQAEAELAAGRSGEARRLLRRLPLDDYALLHIRGVFPGRHELRALLPPMPSEAVQRQWTGQVGDAGMAQATAFLRLVDAGLSALAGRGLRQRRVLDFGAGWGRFTRLLRWYSDAVEACDPWELSRQVSAEAGLILQDSGYYPERLPYDDGFDAVIAYSVFTHTSERAARSGLRAIASALRPDGVAVVTVRPIEFWRYTQHPEQVALTAQAERAGFAFAPHRLEPVDGEVAYGDATATPEWVADASGLRLLGVDRIMTDAYQLCLFLAR